MRPSLDTAAALLQATNGLSFADQMSLVYSPDLNIAQGAGFTYS